MLRVVALLACAVGCKSGNFLTVDVDNIPCGTETLQVTVTLGDTSDDSTFTSDSALRDGTSSFAIDLGTHTDGTLVVTVVASNADHMLATASQPLVLPKHALVLDLHGQTCSLVDAPTVNLDCWHGIAPTNFAPCDDGFPSAGAPLTVNSAQNLDTDADPHYSFGTDNYKLLHVASMDIVASGVLTVTGHYPLLIVSDGAATVTGTIQFESSDSAPECEVPEAPEQSAAAAGGGGGGYATQGANGGANRNGGVLGGIGGTANGNTTIFPLRAGCAGGAGAFGGNTAGGAGGTAPGAIQITSVDPLMVIGSVLVNGGGGGPGSSDNVHLSGGGGGASGGSILLEATQIAVTGKVCAVGGGGGQGGGPVMSGSGGTSSDCVGGVGGGQGAAIAGDGGHGGDDQDPSAGANASTTFGGGGGGGAAGRIRVHGTMSGNGKIVPMPSP